MSAPTEGARRWPLLLRRVGFAALAVLVGGVALGGLALVVLHTAWGAERLRRAVLPRVNDALAGHLEIGRVRPHWNGIELSDVVLSDPGGAVVARLARLDLTLALVPLLSRRIEVVEAALDEPRLTLVQGRQGLNLERALAPRPGRAQPAPEADQPGPPSQLVLRLQRLRIRGGEVELRDLRPGAGPPVHVDQLALEAGGGVALARQSWDARLALDARMKLPLAAPLSLRLDGSGEGARGDGELHLGWGPGRIDLRMHSADATAQVVTIDKISVPPRLVRALVTGAPIAAVIDATGEVKRARDEVTVALDLAAAATHASIRANLDLGRPAARQLRLAARDVDLAHLLVGGPPSRFDLVAEGQASGRDLAHLEGAVVLAIPAGQLDGRPLGPVRIEASAAREVYTLRALTARLPGVAVSGQGQASRTALRLDAKLVASDLALTARSLRLPRALGLAGHGSVALALQGRPDAPGLVATAKIPTLRGAGQEIGELAFSARIADLRRAPQAVDLRVKAGRWKSGGTLVRNLDLAFAGDALGRLQLSLAISAPLRLGLRATGRSGPLGPGAPGSRVRQLDLDSLSLSYPEASWRLVRPARLRLERDQIALADLALAAAPAQQLALDFTRRGARVTGRLAVAGLELGRLPAALLPPQTAVAGTLDATVDASGALERPEIGVAARLVGGKLGKLHDLGLALTARLAHDRLAGKLTARALGADHDASFDLPLKWPPPAQAPVHLEAHIGKIDLAQLAQLGVATAAVGRAVPVPPAGAPKPADLKGRLGAEITVEGPGADPALALQAVAEGLELGGERIDTLGFALSDPIGKPLHAVLTTTVLGRPSRATLDSPIVLAHWARRPPSAEDLLKVPFTVKAEVDHLPLGAVGSTGTGNARAFGGTLSIEAALTGPVTELHGTLNAIADEVRAPHLPATSARLRARLGEGRAGLDANLSVSRRGRPIADLTAALGVGVADLIARRGLGAAPLKVRGRVGPLVLQRSAPGSEGARVDRLLRARFAAELEADGTLGDPRGEVRLDVADGRLAGTPVGDAQVRLHYQAARPHLDVALASAGGGRLDVKADAQLDLSLPAVLRGIVVNEIPVQSQLTAKGLDLKFLSGVSDDVRAVAGHLEADATLSGKLGAPQLVGKLGWQEGRIVLAGFGELRDIELALHGDPREMVLDRLFARSGNGTATLTAKAVRQPDGRRLALDARAEVRDFRVQTDGQPFGTVSLTANASGNVAPDAIEIASKIEEGHVDLAGGSRRQLQSLKRPDDIVLLANGEPIDRTQAKRYEAVRQAQDPAAIAAGRTRSADERRTRVTVEAPRNLWVRGPDANLELGLDPGFVIIDGEALRIFGTVKVRRGFVEVLGRRFDVATDSSVRFTGRPDRPTLAVDATYKAKTAQVTVAVHIEGPPDSLVFTLHSPERPDLGDTELFSLIATGRLPDDAPAGTTAGGQAASLLGGLLADRLQKALTSRLPIDVLTIDAGDSTSGTRLEAGTYFGDKVYVAYVGRLGGDVIMERENRNEVHLEYQLTSRWSFEATYGDARRGSMDLLWTKHY